MSRYDDPGRRRPPSAYDDPYRPSAPQGPREDYSQHYAAEGGYRPQQGGPWDAPQRDYYQGGTFREHDGQFDTSYRGAPGSYAPPGGSYGSYGSPGAYGPQRYQGGGSPGGYQRGAHPGPEAERSSWAESRGGQGTYGQPHDHYPQHHQGPTGYQQQGGPFNAHHEADFDPDYHQWRSEQMRALDADYRNWRQDRYQKFSDEFSSWRQQQQAGTRGNTEAGPGTSGTPVTPPTTPTKAK